MIKELINLVTTITNRILSIVNILANDFDLARWAFEHIPLAETYFTYNQMVILTTIISGLLLTYLLYKAMIIISKRTLNFAFFAQWAVILTILGGIVYDIVKMVI